MLGFGAAEQLYSDITDTAQGFNSVSAAQKASPRLLNHMAFPEINYNTGVVDPRVAMGGYWPNYLRQVRAVGGNDLVQKVRQKRADLDYNRSRSRLAAHEQQHAQDYADIKRGLEDSVRPVTGAAKWLGSYGNTGTWVDFIPSKTARDWYWNRRADKYNEGLKARNAQYEELKDLVDRNDERLKSLTPVKKEK